MFNSENTGEIYLLIHTTREVNFKQAFHEFVNANGLKIYQTQHEGFYAVNEDPFLGTANNYEVEMAYFGPVDQKAARFARGEFEISGFWEQLPAIIVNGNFEKGIEEFLNRSELHPGNHYLKGTISS